MKRISLIILFVALLIMIPVLSHAHHISMSFSDWDLKRDNAKAVFRISLADAVWSMDPDLVIVQESNIQIKRPVDDALKNRLREYLLQTVPQKITLTGCTFDPGLFVVTFPKTAVQIQIEFSCSPGYLDDFEMTNRFLVDKNQLHTSLATIKFSGKVKQFIFRSGQFTYGAGAKDIAAQSAPAWQAEIAPWWDYLALALALLLLVSSSRTLAISLFLIILGNAAAPVALHAGLPMPSSAILYSVLSIFPVYAGLVAYSGARRRNHKSFVWFIAGHALMLALAWTGFLRLTPLMVIGMAMVGTGALTCNSSANPKDSFQAQSRQGALYLLAISFGLVHGFLLLHYLSQYRSPTLFSGESLPWIAMIASAALILPVKRLAEHFKARSWIALALILTGVLIFILRNLNMPFSAFEYENARNLLQNLVQTEEFDPSFIGLALIMAAIIGGLHACTPGHGKTIVAAYLVGTKGRIIDAVILGLVVTFTHTFSVILLAVIALFASKYVLPDQLVPWMSGASGLIIFILGLFLFQSRTRNYLRYGTAAPVHIHKVDKFDNESCRDHADHDLHIHGHPHVHDHGHSHGPGSSHSHALPVTGVTFLSLVALGVTGGIVPCPDALAILLIAISLNKIFAGLALIVSFSVGLAAVLIAIGIAMVKFRPLVERFAGQGKLTNLWLPILSALLISLLGAAILWKAWIGT